MVNQSAGLHLEPGQGTGCGGGHLDAEQQFVPHRPRHDLGHLARIRAGLQLKLNPNNIPAPNQFGNLKLQPLGAAPVEKVDIDKKLLDGLAVVLTELAEQPLALVTVSVKEKGANLDGAKEREDELLKRYTKALLNGVGQELIQFARARVGYKAPEEIVVFDKMPRTATGKLDRTGLKRIAEANLTRG